MLTRGAKIVGLMGLGALVPPVVQLVAAYLLGRSYIDPTQRR